jgi:hypothetical protein
MPVSYPMSVIVFRQNRHPSKLTEVSSHKQTGVFCSGVMRRENQHCMKERESSFTQTHRSTQTYQMRRSFNKLSY